jgi:CRISPR/Cas system CSM-associated protein Csm3 (group 7 of RAMP superfamily)
MTVTIPTLERIERLTIRLYLLTTESHMSIGSGEAAAELRPVDRPVIRALFFEEGQQAPQRIPYIPASSLHGVWRAWVEKALRSQPGNMVEHKAAEDLLVALKAEPNDAHEHFTRALKADLYLTTNPNTKYDEELPPEWTIYKSVCNPFWQSDCCEAPADEDTTRRPLARAKAAWFKRAKSSEQLERPCRVCSIFGHTGRRGRVRFTHAFPAIKDPAQLPLDIITRVAINRQTGAADEGKLFDLEAVPPGVPFYFFVVLENFTDREDIKRFDYGFNALNLNLATLGAHSTVGFGSVSLQLESEWEFQSKVFDFPAHQHNPDEIAKKGDFTYPKSNGSELAARYYPSFFRLLALRRQGKNGKWEGYKALHGYGEKTT